MNERKAGILTVILGVLFVISCKDSGVLKDWEKPGTRVSSDTIRHDTISPDTVRADTIRPDTVRPDTIRPDTIRPDTARPDTTPKPQPRYVSMAGEEFTVMPVAPDSLKGEGVLLTFTSVRSFPCRESHLFVYSGFARTGEGEIRVGDLYIPAGCADGEKKAGGYGFLYPVAQGTHPLKIKVGEITFEGRLTRTGKRFVINWPDNGPIKFEKKEFSF